MNQNNQIRNEIFDFYLEESKNRENINLRKKFNEADESYQSTIINSVSTELMNSFGEMIGHAFLIPKSKLEIFIDRIKDKEKIRYISGFHITGEISKHIDTDKYRSTPCYITAISGSGVLTVYHKNSLKTFHYINEYTKPFLLSPHILYHSFKPISQEVKLINIWLKKEYNNEFESKV